ncbi:MAG: phosphoglycolate phosphatase [Rhodospirillales bacterium]|nr:phosphoglycolate phosphatase [Rhodospirillales bacterium]
MTASPARPCILFDLDGTLVDSLPDLSHALNVMLTRLGRRALAAKEVRLMVGDGAATLVERALTATGGLAHGSLSDHTRHFLEIYEGGPADRTRPYPGADRTLEHLRASGYLMAVCTNKPYAPSIAILEALGLRRFFGAVVGGDSIAGVKKPDPRMVVAALEALDASSARALFVGDSGNDVFAARAAGLPVVAVTFGYSRVPVADLGADATIDALAELPGLADRLLAATAAGFP